MMGTMMTRAFLAGCAVSLMAAAGCGDDADPPTGGMGTGASGAATGTGAGAAGAGGQGTGAGGMAACAAVGPEVVTMDTDDGVTLEGDLYTTGSANGPAAVLLHMNPAGGNDRSNFPSDFIDAVVAQGISVLNIDRRGAGNSGGVATEAFTGPNGKLDAKAAYDYLLAHACAIDPARVAYVGASNGSTTALDLTVYAETEPTVELPGALVFLTGGGYTESQNLVDANRLLLETLPIQFVYSTAEAGWSAPFENGAPPSWSFDEYSNGAHGTAMFNAEPNSVGDVADFLGETL
jgi:X-Pro dipeptidyl-peptidase (S15 family)